MANSSWNHMYLLKCNPPYSSQIAVSAHLERFRFAHLIKNLSKIRRTLTIDPICKSAPWQNPPKIPSKNKNRRNSYIWSTTKDKYGLVAMLRFLSPCWQSNYGFVFGITFCDCSGTVCPIFNAKHLIWGRSPNQKNPKNQRIGEVRPCGTMGHDIQHCAGLVLGSKMSDLSD